MTNYEKIHQILRSEDRSNWKSEISKLVHEDKDNHELIMNDNSNDTVPILLDSLDSSWNSGFPINEFVKDSDGKVFFVNGYAPLDCRYNSNDKDSNALRILTHGDTVDLVELYNHELFHNEIFPNESLSSNYTVIDKSEVSEEFKRLLSI